MTTAKIRFYNLPARAHADATEPHLLAMGADAVGFAEGGHLLPELSRIPGFRPVAIPELPSEPLIYSDVWNLTGRTQVAAYPPTHVGPWGAGPGTMTAGWDNAVRLELQGFAFWLIVCHLVPSVDRKATTHADKAARAERRRLYRAEIAQLAGMAPPDEPAVIVGDMNVAPGSRFLRPLLDAGFTDIQPGVTHKPGGRLDHAFVRGLDVISSRVIPGRWASDHEPIELVVG